MKTRNHILLLAAPLALAISVISFTAGCEAKSPDQNEIKVSPRNIVIGVGQSVELTASGWHAYKWSLGEKNIGFLSATTGTKVTYTAAKAGEQIVTASPSGLPTDTKTVTRPESGTGTQTGGTNSTENVITVTTASITPGEATISHPR